MKKAEWFILLFGASSVIILTTGWHVTFESRTFDIIFHFGARVLVLASLIYALNRLLHLLTNAKVAKVTTVTTILLATFALERFSYLITPPIQNTYLKLYTKSSSNYETVEITSNHGYVQTWNEMRYKISYPKLGLSFSKKINQEQLDGSWIVHLRNPYCEIIGEAQFEKGKRIED